MYSGLKYLLSPTVDVPKNNNNKASGGFPHSETHGSKPIPGSPWLIAGYHVLHRLLLPRHPPNALFALDLIQEEQGRWFTAPHPLGVKSFVLSHATVPESTVAVSVLDLEQYRSWPRGQPTHTRIGQAILMFLSLNDVNFRPVGRANTSADALADQTASHATNPGRTWWSLSGSNR